MIRYVPPRRTSKTSDKYGGNGTERSEVNAEPGGRDMAGQVENRGGRTLSVVRRAVRKAAGQPRKRNENRRKLHESQKTRERARLGSDNSLKREQEEARKASSIRD